MADAVSCRLFVHKFTRLAIFQSAIFIYISKDRRVLLLHCYDYVTHLFSIHMFAERHFELALPNFVRKCPWVTYQNVKYGYFIHRKYSGKIFSGFSFPANFLRNSYHQSPSIGDAMQLQTFHTFDKYTYVQISLRFIWFSEFTIIIIIRGMCVVERNVRWQFLFPSNVWVILGICMEYCIRSNYLS